MFSEKEYEKYCSLVIGDAENEGESEDEEEKRRQEEEELDDDEERRRNRTKRSTTSDGWRKQPLSVTSLPKNLELRTSNVDPNVSLREGLESGTR